MCHRRKIITSERTQDAPAGIAEDINAFLCSGDIMGLWNETDRETVARGKP